jgi:ABC-type transporter Mla MlaB component
MVAYTVVHGRSEIANTTLHIEGEVTASDWEKLRELSLFALKNSDRLTLNLKKISGHDYSLSIFVCLLRRTVQLQNKQLSVQGKQQEGFVCVFEAALESKTKWCSFTEAGNCCIWENLYSKITLQSQ